MGIVCDAYHKPIFYDHTLDDYTVSNGIIITKNKKIFEIINERLINSTGNDMPYYHQKTIVEVEEYRRQKAVKAQKKKEEEMRL